MSNLGYIKNEIQNAVPTLFRIFKQSLKSNRNLVKHNFKKIIDLFGSWILVLKQ